MFFVAFTYHPLSHATNSQKVFRHLGPTGLKVSVFSLGMSAFYNAHCITY